MPQKTRRRIPAGLVQDKRIATLTIARSITSGRALRCRRGSTSSHFETSVQQE